MYCLPIITYPFRDKDGLRYTFRRQLSANNAVEGRYLISWKEIKKDFMVGRAGLEPALPKGPDLQSGAVPTTLYRPVWWGAFNLYWPILLFFAWTSYILNNTRTFALRP